MSVIPNLNDLLILERLVASKAIGMQPNRPVNSILLGKHRSKMRGRGLDFEEARKYVTGDDIRNIDWRVTAKTGTTHTKIFTEEKEKPCFVITDLTQSMFFGSQVYTKSFLACQFAAVIAFEILHNQDRFGGLIFGNKGEHFFTPQRNRNVLLQYFNELIKRANLLLEEPHKIGSDSNLLSKALEKANALVKHDYMLVVISDFNKITEKCKSQLIKLAQHNDVVLVKINDALEVQMPTQKMVLSDGDVQLLWQHQKKNAKENYDLNMADYNQNFMKEMQIYGIPLLQLNTYQSLEEQLKKSNHRDK